MDLVVDASVVVKWFLEEAGSDRAGALRDDFAAEDVTLHAPEILPFEVMSALCGSGAYSEEKTLQAQLALEQAGFRIHRFSDELARRAVHLVYERRLTIYDAAYLALARVLPARLVTADDALVRAGGRDAVPLDDYASGTAP